MLRVTPVHTVFHKDKLFAALADAYDIGTPSCSRFVSNGLNDTYIVETNRGSFVLRIYKHNWRTEADIRFELELLIHLQNRGIPVSVPNRPPRRRIANRTGRS